jgi:hypothetical protein
MRSLCPLGRAEEWLNRLLTVLEGDYSADPDDPKTAYGYTNDA